MITIPNQPLQALSLLRKAGFEGYMIGGCVRDMLMDKQPSDYDIATSALPDEIIKVFRDYKIVKTGIKHGTVTAIIDEMNIEITTYRQDGRYLDNRHPEKVIFTRMLQEDLKRRDFTINSMAFDEELRLVDYFGGEQDIHDGVIRCVGEANERFQEDALRIIRALRFSAVLGFELEEKTGLAVMENRELLKNISKERVRDELKKLICGKAADICIENNIEVVKTMIPCVKEGDGRLLKHSPDDIEIRLSLLLYDLTDREANQLLENLKFDNSTKKAVSEILRFKMMEIEETDRSVKWALNKVTEKNFFKLIKVKQIKSQKENQKKYVQIASIARRVIEQGECYHIRNLVINGSDLIDIGLCEGKVVGEVLDELLRRVIAGELSNTKEELISYTEKILKKSPN